MDHPQFKMFMTTRQRCTAVREQSMLEINFNFKINSKFIENMIDSRFEGGFYNLLYFESPIFLDILLPFY